MKKILEILYTAIYKLLHLFERNVRLTSSCLWNVAINLTSQNELCMRNSHAKRLVVNCIGEDNVIVADGVVMDNCELRVSGKANSITIAPHCKCHNAVIVVNGNNCNIYIGDSTTIGSMYMVCMGQGNYITIGEECMIADNVDIWASDAHPIFDKRGEIINPSSPIVIGSHVWLGKYAKVLKGVTIHDNAIVGMNAMITKDIISNSMVVGQNRVVKENVNWDRKFISA